MNRPLAFSRRQALLGGAALLVACGSDENVPVTGATPTPSPLASPVPAGSRILGISPTERQDGNFDAVIANLQSARVSNATISFAWDDIETSPGTYAPDPNFPAIANLYYPAMGVSLTVVIVGIDTTADRRPADLQGLAWDDPRIVTRFRAMQDWLIEQLRDVTITAWSIGNEVDAALADDAASWRAWRRFFEQVAPSARARLGNVPVGSKVTSNVLQSTVGRAAYRTLLESADCSMFTYYPAGSDFRSDRLPDVAADFDAMLSAYPNLPLRLHECGFCSAASLGSSEGLQADFVSAVFAAWDQYAANIPQLDYFAVHDFSPEGVQFYLQYYGVGGQAFADWLGSLGLRRWDGTPKAGWQRFVDEASVRGFQA